MKILFIYPNLNAEEGFNHGVACLAGALKANGHSVSLINLNESLADVPSIEQIVQMVRDYNPELLAFSVQTMQYEHALRISKAIRDALPNLRQIIGGVHATLCLDELIKEGYWELISYGECDETFPQLINRLENSQPIDDLNNLAIKRPDGRYKVNPLAPYPDLAKLPPEDYEIFDLDNMLAKKNGWLSILTSRGCPYRCSYCFNYELSGLYASYGHSRKSYLRRYPVERVINEIRQIIEQHPLIETIIFDDDLFTLDTDWVVRFCKAYNDANIEIPFVVNAHVQSFNEQAAEALGSSRCKIVKFGVESGSEQLRREFLKRYMTNDAITQAFGLCDKYNLHSSAFLMFGMPGETMEQMFQTIDLIVRIKPGRMRWSVFYPFPGTLSYKIAEEKNLIDHDKLAKLDNYFVTTALKFDPQTELFVNKLQRTFHWYVNARIDWQASDIYREQIKQLEQISADDWPSKRDEILKIDRQISDELLNKGIEHYSIRYTEVMAVHSSYLLAERPEYRNQKSKTWQASQSI